MDVKHVVETLEELKGALLPYDGHKLPVTCEGTLPKEWPLTRTQVESYVTQLDPQVQRIYHETESLTMSIRDTLSDNFQIAAEIQDVFARYAKKGTAA